MSIRTVALAVFLALLTPVTIVWALAALALAIPILLVVGVLLLLGEACDALASAARLPGCL